MSLTAFYSPVTKHYFFLWIFYATFCDYHDDDDDDDGVDHRGRLEPVSSSETHPQLDQAKT